MTINSVGGLALEHLAQEGGVGGVGITQEVYDELNEAACALAGNFAMEAGEKEYAQEIFAELGRLAAWRISKIAPRPKR